MGEPSFTSRLRTFLAGLFFALAGRLHPAAYDVWLDDAPRRNLRKRSMKYLLCLVIGHAPRVKDKLRLTGGTWRMDICSRCGWVRDLPSGDGASLTQWRPPDSVDKA